MYVRALGPLNTLDMDLDADITLRQQWRDPRLIFTGDHGAKEFTLKDVERVWRPDTFLRNDKDSSLFTVPAPSSYARVSEDGTVLYSVRLKSKLHCPLNLALFPFDTQTCSLMLASCKPTSN